MVKFEKEAKELIKEMNFVTQPDIEIIEIVAKKLKEMYNKGRSWKRDREFLSKEDHEKAYKSKRKKPFKEYKKKVI